MALSPQVVFQIYQHFKFSWMQATVCYAYGCIALQFICSVTSLDNGTHVQHITFPQKSWKVDVIQYSDMVCRSGPDTPLSLFVVVASSLKMMACVVWLSDFPLLRQSNGPHRYIFLIFRQHDTAAGHTTWHHVSTAVACHSSTAHMNWVMALGDANEPWPTTSLIFSRAVKCD